MSRAFISGVFALSLLLGACGSEPDVAASRPSPTDPDSPVSHTPDPNEPIPSPTASRVEPQPGQIDVRPIPWERYDKHGPKTLEFFFWSGVEPCYVLDRVEVEESEERVKVTLFQGRTETDEDIACIEIAVEKSVVVELDAPLAGRKVVDGAPN